MGDFAKIGLSVALGDEEIAAWVDRMSPQSLERRRLELGELQELWMGGIRAWRMLQGCSTGSAMPLFAPEEFQDEEERRLRAQVEGRMGHVAWGLSLMRATIFGMESKVRESGDLEVGDRLREIGALMDQALPEDLQAIVTAASEAGIAQISAAPGAPSRRRAGL